MPAEQSNRTKKSRRSVTDPDQQTPIAVLLGNVIPRLGGRPFRPAQGYVIDFKTTISPRLDPTWLYQVLSYILLEYPPEHAVRGVGFSLVRQGVLVRWRLEHLIFRLMKEKPVPLEQLRTEFRELLSGAYGLHSQWSFSSGRKPWRGAPWGA